MKKLVLTIKQFQQCKTVEKMKAKICGEMIGRGTFRDVYECKINPLFVVKIERDPSIGMFANATEWRNWHNNRHWTFINKWLAECILINETGQVMIQRRVNWDGKKRKDYPNKIPYLLTDTKVANFGWIGDQFVCCDYSFLRTGSGNFKNMVTPKWVGSFKKLQKSQKAKRKPIQ